MMTIKGPANLGADIKSKATHCFEYLQVAGLLEVLMLVTVTVKGEKLSLSVVKQICLVPASSGTLVSGVSQETRITTNTKIIKKVKYFLNFCPS